LNENCAALAGRRTKLIEASVAADAAAKVRREILLVDM
jgi:hypothetical protein